MTMKFGKYWVKQFCLNTNLHGYRFIALPGRAPIERFLWTAIVVFFGLSALVILVYNRDRTARRSATFITDSINHPIWNFPFPAVTICSFNKISKRRAFYQAEKIPHKLNMSVEEIAGLFALLGQLYFSAQNIQLSDTKKYLQLLQLLDHNNIDLNRMLRSISPRCNDVVVKCKWKGEDKNCDMIFEKIITTEGHCCSFNYYAPKNHIFGGLLYPTRSPKKPRRVSACGYASALEVLIAIDKDDYFSSDTLSFGSKVIIHNSVDYPDWADQSFLLGTKVTALLGLNPILTHSSDDLRSLSIRERACYFEEEFSLLNFRSYTYQNCLTECRMNLTRHYCGCIPVIYVNEDVYVPNDHKVCSARNMGCLNQHRPSIRSSVPGVANNNFTDFVWDSDDLPCGCLPECSSTKYTFQSSYSTLLITHTPWVDKRGLYFGVNLSDHSVVRVFFNDLVGTRNRRSVLGNWQTFLALYGGILGLFMGFSFMAGIETVYFFTIKMFIEYRKTKKLKEERKKGHDQFYRKNKNLKTNYSNLERKFTMKSNNYLGYYLE